MANSRTPSDEITKEGFGIHARRAIAYIFLIIITILCLFWFYVLFVNATRTHSEIQLGFHALPGTNFAKNFYNTIINGSQPVWNRYHCCTECCINNIFFNNDGICTSCVYL